MIHRNFLSNPGVGNVRVSQLESLDTAGGMQRPGVFCTGPCPIVRPANHMDGPEKRFNIEACRPRTSRLLTGPMAAALTRVARCRSEAFRPVATCSHGRVSVVPHMALLSCLDLNASAARLPVVLHGACPAAEAWQQPGRRAALRKLKRSIPVRAQDSLNAWLAKDIRRLKVKVQEAHQQARDGPRTWYFFV